MAATFFCASGLSSLIALVLLKQRCRNGAARTALPEMRQVGSSFWRCRNSAAKNAPSWAQVAKLAASMVQICQTCSKYGNISHTWRISGSSRYDHARKAFSLYFVAIVEIAYQRLSANPQAAVLLSWWFLYETTDWFQIERVRVIRFTTKRSNWRETTAKQLF